MMRRLLLPFLGLLTVAAAQSSRVADAAPRSQYVYVHNYSNPNQVFGYRFTRTGDLVALPNSPFAAGATGEVGGGTLQTMAVSNRRDLLFTSGGSGIQVHRIARSGNLTPVGLPVGSASLAGVAVVESGSKTFVYAAQPDEQQIRGFEVLGSGALQELSTSPYATGGPVRTLASAGKLVFGGNLPTSGGTGGSIASFTVNSRGALVAAPGSPVAVPAGVALTSVHPIPNGKLLYAGNGAGASVLGYRVNTRNAALTALPESGLDIALPNSKVGVPLSNGSLMYAQAEVDSGADLQPFRRSGSGSLTPVNDPFPSGLGPQFDAGAFDPSGQFLVVTNDGPGLVCSFITQSNNGVLRLRGSVQEAGTTDFTAVVFAKP